MRFQNRNLCALLILELEAAVVIVVEACTRNPVWWYKVALLDMLLEYLKAWWRLG